jgi:hypothetical protein
MDAAHACDFHRERLILYFSLSMRLELWYGAEAKIKTFLSHSVCDLHLRSVAGFAQRLWTSVATLRGAGRPARELCGLVNEALRRDDAALLQPLMVRAP